MDELQILTPSEMLKSFIGIEDQQFTHSGTESETSLALYGQRESVSSSSRGSLSSLSTIDDDSSGKPNKLIIYTNIAILTHDHGYGCLQRLDL